MTAEPTSPFLFSAMNASCAPGAVLISALSSSFLSGIESNPDVPAQVPSSAQTHLAGGVPFISDDALGDALSEAGVENQTANAIVEDNEQARIDALRASLSVLAIVAMLALFVTRGIPSRQPVAQSPGPSS